jgi:hypothetical protein
MVLTSKRRHNDPHLHSELKRINYVIRYTQISASNPLESATRLRLPIPEVCSDRPQKLRVLFPRHSVGDTGKRRKRGTDGKREREAAIKGKKGKVVPVLS